MRKDNASQIPKPPPNHSQQPTEGPCLPPFLEIMQKISTLLSMNSCEFLSSLRGGGVYVHARARVFKDKVEKA
jgi:hypothetical protein